MVSMRGGFWRGIFAEQVSYSEVLVELREMHLVLPAIVMEFMALQVEGWQSVWSLRHVFGGTFNAAGYFNGDVWADNYFTISDRKLKTGITQLTASASLEQLMRLKPSAYEFKTADYPQMGLPKGKQIGLIADEVKQVFPELVKEAVHPAQYEKDKRMILHPEEKYEGINYIGFIPVLIASIQEQQKTIDDIKAENEAMKAENQELEITS